MTLWTGFYSDLLFLSSTSNCVCVSTWAGYWYLFIIWMDCWFHRYEWLRVGCDRSSAIVEDTNASLYFFMAKYETNNGGPGRDRTYEGEAKGFTVLPIWPLWNRPRIWSHLSDLNWWPPVYKTDALPTELRWRVRYCIKNGCLVKIFSYNLSYDPYNSHLRWRETLLWSG